MAQVTANIVKPAPMNMPNMSVYNPNQSPAASALNSRMGTSPTPTLSYNQRAAAGLSPLLTPSQPRVSPINPGVSQHPAAQPYASAPVDNSAIAAQLDAIKQQALKIQSAIPGASAGTALQAPAQPQTTATGATTASQPPSYSGLVGALSNTSTAGSPTAQGYTANTANYGAGNIPIGQSAADIAANYGKQIADVGAKGAQFEGGQLTTGTNPIAEGNAAITAQTTAAQQQALATGETAALQGTAQQLTAQDQAATATNAAAGQATTAQGQTITGLTNAAGAIRPEQNYPFVFNPATGTYTNQATGGTASANDLADAVLSGKMSYSDAKSGASYLGSSAEAQLQAAILAKNPNANLNQLEAQAAGQQAVASAPYSAQASNIGTAGTAQTGAWGSVLSTATTNAANYAAQQSAINAVGSQALALMQSNGINPISSQYANTKLNQVATQFSDPKYAAFNTAIQSLQARISQALQAGEIPTAATGNAQAIANGNLTLGALASTLKQVDAEMSTFVGTQNSLKDYAQSQLTQGASGNKGGSGSGDPLGIL